MSDDPAQWRFWFDEFKRATACPDRVTIREFEDYEFGYGIYVDGKLARGRTKEDSITREAMSSDIDAVLVMVRDGCDHTQKRANGNDDPTRGVRRAGAGPSPAWNAKDRRRRGIS